MISFELTDLSDAHFLISLAISSFDVGISDSEGEKLERLADILLLELLLLAEAPAAVKGEDGLLECQRVTLSVMLYQA